MYFALNSLVSVCRLHTNFEVLHSLQKYDWATNLNMGHMTHFNFFHGH